MNDEDKIINSRRAGFFAQGAAIDVKQRNAEAYDEHREFFDSEEHASRVEAVEQIIEDFFPVKEVYVNRRKNRGKPFTVVKVTKHRFPQVSLAEKERRYRKPLRDLGVQITFSAGSNSYLFRID